ncbi:redB [Symbiodinium natans]|uniref:RedB protein n=1 Tax=Symbiodinium natans TaxID=878477 RepID=A0A812TTC2_9DINO|nr:redB [Symbiodinium natans]
MCPGPRSPTPGSVVCSCSQGFGQRRPLLPPLWEAIAKGRAAGLSEAKQSASLFRHFHRLELGSMAHGCGSQEELATSELQRRRLHNLYQERPEMHGLWHGTILDRSYQDMKGQLRVYCRAAGLSGFSSRTVLLSLGPASWSCLELFPVASCFKVRPLNAREKRIGDKEAMQVVDSNTLEAALRARHKL